MFSTKERSAWEKLWITERKIRFLCIDRTGWEILLTVEKQEESEKSKNASEMLKKISAEVVRT